MPKLVPFLRWPAMGWVAALLPLAAGLPVAALPAAAATPSASASLSAQSVATLPAAAATPSASVSAQSSAAASVATASVGVNLTTVRDWTTEWPFVDVFRTSREWISQRSGAPWGTGPALDLDANGWVQSLRQGQYVDTAVLTNGRYSAPGRYVLTWEGDGDVSLYGSSTPVNRTAHRFEFDKPTASLFVRITRVNPADHVRKIHIWMPGFEQTGAEQVFHPLFLDRLRGMRTLRFKDWMNVDYPNHLDASSWSRYPRPDSSTQVAGVAPELMTDLSNRVGADPWFSMPHAADDTWVRSFAKAVHASLAPGRKAYVEYSNELWNPIYTQTSYIQDQGIRLGLSDNRFTAGLRYQALRSVEIFRIWQDVFGADANSRLVRVLATQSANPWTGEQVTGWQDAYRSADALSIAPYFECSGQWVPGDSNSYAAGSGTAAPFVKAAGVAKLLDMCQRQIDGPMRTQLTAYRTIAERYGLALIGYEGGQHLAAIGNAQQDTDLVALLHAANRTTRMHDLYARYLNQWQSLGGGTMALYNSTETMSQYGSWGLLEYQNQPVADAPKYRATTEFMQALRNGPPRAVVPNVTGLSITTAPGSGGTKTTITGSRLGTATAVTFGGTAAVFSKVQTGGVTSLIATVPQHAAGNVDVVVTNSGGGSVPTSASRFAYQPPPPVVTSLSPSTAGIGGGTTVTLTGRNLTGANAVIIAGASWATNVHVLSDTSLQFTTPPWRAGTYDVTVGTPSGRSVTVGKLTFVAAPTVSALTPSSVNIGGGTTVTLAGVNLTGVRAVRIAGGATYGTAVKVLSDRSLQFTTPAWRVGTFDLALSTSSGDIVPVGTITYVPPPTPVVTALSPSSGTASRPTTVVLTGTDIDTAWRVTVGGATVPFTRLSATSLRVVIPSHAPGNGLVQVSTNGGTNTAGPVFTWVR